MEPVPIFGKEFVNKVSGMLANALDSIDIIVYEWKFEDNDKVSAIGLFNEAIFKAVKRGVKVRVITTSKKTQALLEKEGVICKVLTTNKTLHTKILILDRFHIVLGSHNYTERAFTENYELSVYFVCSDFENKYVQYFENLWSY